MLIHKSEKVISPAFVLFFFNVIFTHLCFTLQDLESQLRQALDDKTRFKMQADRASDQLADRQRQCDQLQQVLVHI